MTALITNSFQINPKPDFHIIEQALNNLKLFHDPKKTKCMRRLSSSFLIDSSISTLNETPTERVLNNKYLGIWIDDKLSFKIHVSELTKKLKRKLSSFYRNRACFTLKCRKQFVKGTFIPVDYVAVIYMHAALSTLKPLDAVYHSAHGFITDDELRTHDCVLYNKVGWTSLSVRREQHCMTIIYKALLHGLLVCVTTFILFRACNLLTQESLILNIPTVRTTLGKTAFQVYPPQKLNDLQRALELNRFISLGNFKCLLFTVLQSECNCEF